MVLFYYVCFLVSFVVLVFWSKGGDSCFGFGFTSHMTLIRSGSVKRMQVAVRGHQ